MPRQPSADAWDQPHPGSKHREQCTPFLFWGNEGDLPNVREHLVMLLANLLWAWPGGGCPPEFPRKPGTVPVRREKHPWRYPSLHQVPQEGSAGCEAVGPLQPALPGPCCPHTAPLQSTSGPDKEAGDNQSASRSVSRARTMSRACCTRSFPPQLSFF